MERAISCSQAGVCATKRVPEAPGTTSEPHTSASRSAGAKSLTWLTGSSALATCSMRLRSRSTTASPAPSKMRIFEAT